MFEEVYQVLVTEQRNQILHGFAPFSAGMTFFGCFFPDHDDELSNIYHNNIFFHDFTVHVS